MSLLGALIGGGLSAGGQIASNVIQAEYNKKEAQKNRDFQTTERLATQEYNALEAQKNRDFQQQMRDTSLISSIEQAKKLGISPSLVMGQGSTALGGSQASSSAGGGATAHASFENPLNSLGQALVNTINEKTKKRKTRRNAGRKIKTSKRNARKKIKSRKGNATIKKYSNPKKKI